jgi:hypothetical protein
MESNLQRLRSRWHDRLECLKMHDMPCKVSYDPRQLLRSESTNTLENDPDRADHNRTSVASVLEHQALVRRHGWRQDPDITQHSLSRRNENAVDIVL